MSDINTNISGGGFIDAVNEAIDGLNLSPSASASSVISSLNTAFANVEGKRVLVDKCAPDFIGDVNYNLGLMDGGGDEPAAYTWPEDKPLKLLIIGNSHSADTWSYAPYILKKLLAGTNYSIIIGFCFRHGNTIYSISKEGYAQNWNAEIQSNQGKSSWHVANFFYFDTRNHNDWVKTSGIISYPEDAVKLENSSLRSSVGFEEVDKWDVVSIHLGPGELTSETITNYYTGEADQKITVMYDYIRRALGGDYIKGYMIHHATISENLLNLISVTNSNNSLISDAILFPVATAVLNLTLSQYSGVKPWALQSGIPHRNLLGDNLHLQCGLPYFTASMTVVHALLNAFGLDINTSGVATALINDANFTWTGSICAIDEPNKFAIGDDNAYLELGRLAAMATVNNPYTPASSIDNLNVTFRFDDSLMDVYYFMNNRYVQVYNNTPLSFSRYAGNYSIKVVPKSGVSVSSVSAGVKIKFPGEEEMTFAYTSHSEYSNFGFSYNSSSGGYIGRYNGPCLLVDTIFEITITV